MPIDLLPQIRTMAQQGNNPYLGVTREDVDDPYLAEFYQVIKLMRADLKQMDQNVTSLQQATNEKIHSIDGKRAGNQVDSLIDQINGAAQKLRAQLDRIGEHTKTMEQVECTDDRIVFNIRGALMSQYVLTMQRYQEIQTNYNDKSRDILITQVKLKNPNASEAEIQAKIDSGDTQQLQIASAKLDMANESYNYVAARHKEILKLEKSLQEVHQLFVDMAALVDAQGEVIDRIAFRVANAKADVAIAKDELTEAYRIKRRTCVVM